MPVAGEVDLRSRSAGSRRAALVALRAHEADVDDRDRDAAAVDPERLQRRTRQIKPTACDTIGPVPFDGHGRLRKRSPRTPSSSAARRSTAGRARDPQRTSASARRSARRARAARRAAAHRPRGPPSASTITCRSSPSGVSARAARSRCRECSIRATRRIRERPSQPPLDPSLHGSSASSEARCAGAPRLEPTRDQRDRPSEAAPSEAASDEGARSEAQPSVVTRTWRRGRDSNPGRVSACGFQDRRLRPLGHLSASRIRRETYRRRRSDPVEWPNPATRRKENHARPALHSRKSRISSGRTAATAGSKSTSDALVRPGRSAPRADRRAAGGAGTAQQAGARHEGRKPSDEERALGKESEGARGCARGRALERTRVELARLHTRCRTSPTPPRRSAKTDEDNRELRVFRAHA